MFMLFRHVPSGAFPSAEISPSVHLALPLCEDSPAARPAFSRVGSCTGLRFCIAPLDNTLRALLRLSMFMLLKQILARRFPFCGDFPVGSSGASPLGRFSRRPPGFSCVGSYTGLRFCIAPLDNTLRASLCLPCPYFSSKFPSK